MTKNARGGILPAVSGGVGISIILARELIVSSFRMVAASKKVVIAADKLGKIKTVSQDIALVLLLFSKAFEGSVFVIIWWIGYALFIFSVLMTVISGINYIWKNRVVFKED
jgi:CDP-diacylglycerol--glycerol-3-phosphate 3-phosphatidyltransferase